MEEAAKEWFTAGAHDKVNFEINLMIAPGPLGKPYTWQWALVCPWCCLLWLWAVLHVSGHIGNIIPSKGKGLPGLCSQKPC